MRVAHHHFLLFLSSAAACSGDHDHKTAHGGASCVTDPRKDTYAANMVKSGKSGYQVRVLESQPAPPQKTDNSWRLEILDSAGQTQTGLNVAVEPFMPDHGHGTPISVTVTPPADGRSDFHASPINLWMPGIWRISVHINRAATQLDTVDFFFCIEG
jgi:hypothetical protein